jgi:hypothetical protein
MDFLARTIGTLTGSNIPFNIGDQINNNNVDTQFPSLWAIHDGTVKVCNTQDSVEGWHC